MLRLSLFLSLFVGLISFSSCSKTCPPGAPTGKYTNGTFILNQGDNNTPSSNPLGFIDENGVLTKDAYKLENGKMLPALPQDMFISNDNIYIICHRSLIVADAHTLKLKNEYTTELGEFAENDLPYRVAVLGDDVFILITNYSTTSRVIRFNLTTKETTLVGGTEGVRYGSKMAVVGNRLYAVKNTRVVVMQQGVDEVATITIDADIAGVNITASDDGNLWLAGGSDTRNAIMKLDFSSHTIAYHNINHSLASQWTTPSISAIGNDIYFTTVTGGLGVHDYAKNETKMLVENFDTYIPDSRYTSGIVYGGVEVNPKNSNVYVNIIKAYGEYGTNDLLLFDMLGNTPVVKKSYQDKTSFPIGAYFTESFKSR